MSRWDGAIQAKPGPGNAGKEAAGGSSHMSSDNWISNALQALAEHDRGQGAPEEVEARVLAAFRQNRARRKRKTVVLATTLAAAASLVLFLARPQDHPKQIAPMPVRPETVAILPFPTPERKAVLKSRPVKRPRVMQPREIVTEFFPLLDVAPPFERGELLRVTVPASTMRRVGLPVNENRLEERVYADVLVGQEGLARAIRFVSYEQ